ncbi:acyltransferase [Paenibacillus sabinae]|uniref:Acetyltransferase n=1 Tax=Paenibacillus sabinae T27 TaxID=1268072 RepID=X4ZEA2_9BACL|nr:acyltransferase [Paenibacillus sabinae]AHV95787.1 hypothetical protein PSAB_04255 [Paenibacillus sabinae T27]
MFERVKKAIALRLGRISTEQLNIEACIRQGMKVGRNCHGLGAATIDYAHCWLIEIGDNVTFAPQVYLLAHDASTKRHLDYTKIAKIVIEDGAFIGARALIMPGVTVGKNAIVAAGSIVTKSVPEGMVVAGNQARVLSTTEAYIQKHQEKMGHSDLYDENWTIGRRISPDMCRQMSDQLINGSVGYVK